LGEGNRKYSPKPAVTKAEASVRNLISRPASVND